MCGFAGFWGGAWPGDETAVRSRLQTMADTIAHRGPDSAGYWWDARAGMALAHRRLAVVDLSASGHQPMHSPGGRYVMVFNGEIYNHLALRDELAASGRAPVWRGHSDTETLLAGFDAWGIEGTLRQCRGMFSLAVWDQATQVLSLARDRFGEKPLYFGQQDGRGTSSPPVFLFGSELKALRAHPQFEGGIDSTALSLYFRFNNIPAPRTIYQGLHKVMPGTLVTVNRELTVTSRPFWSMPELMAKAVRAPFVGADQDAIDQLEARLARVIDLQSDADVPLGAFLSGGIDSSTVVALMQARSRKRGLPAVKTFSIGFREDGYDEASHAREVARHLGTDHTELYVSASQAMDTIPALSAVYDEPFADSSQIPMMLVSRLARQRVTVALSGDGGDELFAGYHRHHFAARHWPGLQRTPRPLRSALARLARQASPRSLERLAGSVGITRHLAHAGEKLGKLAKVLDATSIEDAYLRLLSQWDEPLVTGVEEDCMALADGLDLAGLSAAEWMMALDLLHYLPGDVLTKVDRAGMAASLEVRVPFLDHELASFAWGLPMHMKLRQGVSKWVLRQVLYRHVPAPLIERPKMGFAVPIGQWLKGPLRDWAEALLSPARLKQQGLLRAGLVRDAWAQHLRGEGDHQHRLWSVLMFQQWLDQQGAS